MNTTKENKLKTLKIVIEMIMDEKLKYYKNTDDESVQKIKNIDKLLKIKSDEYMSLKNS